MLNKIISDGKIPMWKENKMALWRLHCLDKIRRIDCLYGVVWKGVFVVSFATYDEKKPDYVSNIHTYSRR